MSFVNSRGSTNIMVRVSVLILTLVRVSGFGGPGLGLSTCKDGQFFDFVGAYRLEEWNILQGDDAQVLPAATTENNVTDCLKFVANNDLAFICVEIAADGELCFRVDDNANNPGTVNHYFVSEGTCETAADLMGDCVPNDAGSIPIVRSIVDNNEPAGNEGIVVNEGDYFCFNFDAPINVDLWCAPQAPGFSFPDM